ncbi:hypothetical protein GZ78_11480 [Endozoicomonas numazuensis]|uniref:Uncharacterized protein n=1 Tax=Endozoicomonas numazuensis TaxID=1137799 RepID=A0A081NI94_9GAMM|nr:hypothetical protein GZ78_11480 [Endozoicomonas numazuensis]
MHTSLPAAGITAPPAKNEIYENSKAAQSSGSGRFMMPDPLRSYENSREIMAESSTRYERLGRNYLGMIHLAASVLWLT